MGKLGLPVPPGFTITTEVCDIFYSNKKKLPTKILSQIKAKNNTNLISAEILKIENLKVWYPIKKGIFRRTTDYVKAVDGLNLEVKVGQTLGVVGESGSGKTTLGLALLRLISSRGHIKFKKKSIQE